MELENGFVCLILGSFDINVSPEKNEVIMDNEGEFILCIVKHIDSLYSKQTIIERSNLPPTTPKPIYVSGETVHNNQDHKNRHSGSRTDQRVQDVDSVSDVLSGRTYMNRPSSASSKKTSNSSAARVPSSPFAKVPSSPYYRPYEKKPKRQAPASDFVVVQEGSAPSLYNRIPIECSKRQLTIQETIDKGRKQGKTPVKDKIYCPPFNNECLLEPNPIRALKQIDLSFPAHYPPKPPTNSLATDINQKTGNIINQNQKSQVPGKTLHQTKISQCFQKKCDNNLISNLSRTLTLVDAGAVNYTMETIREECMKLKTNHDELTSNIPAYIGETSDSSSRKFVIFHNGLIIYAVTKLLNNMPNDIEVPTKIILKMLWNLEKLMTI
jgi:DNA mismatch repair ATPase MutL